MVRPDEIMPVQCLLAMQIGILDGVEDQDNCDAELVCRSMIELGEAYGWSAPKR